MKKGWSFRKEEKPAPLRKKSVQDTGLTEKGRELFDELRKLRLELARKRSVPPYVVASDRTLRDMCARIPLTREELLAVNGMGEKKIEQYGGAFLKKLQEVTRGDRKAWGASPGPDADRNASASPDFHAPEEAGTEETGKMPLTDRKSKDKKVEFALTDEILSGFQFLPAVTLSDFAAQINGLRDEKRMKRLTVKWLTEKLMEEDCLEREYRDGYARTVLTEKGKEAGILAESRTSARGNPYEVFRYTEKAQRYLLKLLKQC